MGARGDLRLCAPSLRLLLLELRLQRSGSPADLPALPLTLAEFGISHRCPKFPVTLAEFGISHWTSGLNSF